MQYLRTTMEPEDIIQVWINRRIRMVEKNDTDSSGQLSNIQIKLDPDIRASSLLFNHDHFTENQLEQIARHLATIPGLEGKIEERVQTLNY